MYASGHVLCCQMEDKLTALLILAALPKPHDDGGEGDDGDDGDGDGGDDDGDGDGGDRTTFSQSLRIPVKLEEQEGLLDALTPVQPLVRSSALSGCLLHHICHPLLRERPREEVRG